MGLEEKLTLIDRADITEGGFLLKGRLDEPACLLESGTK